MATPEERLSRLEEAVEHRATKTEMAQLEIRLHRYTFVLLTLIATLVSAVVIAVDRL